MLKKKKTATSNIATSVGKTALDALSEQGFVLPSECGGQGTCGQCRVCAIQGAFNQPTASERALISEPDRHRGVRLACRMQGAGKLRFEALETVSQQLDLGNHRRVQRRLRFGVAVDVGTTTLRLSLMDIGARERLGSVQVLNRQASFGADVMTRLAHAMEGSTHRHELAQAIRDQIFEHIVSLAKSHGADHTAIERVVLVANTAMTHLLCDEPVELLALMPYESAFEGRGCLTHLATHWGWSLAPEAVCQLMPVVRSFVGSDLLADLIEVGIAHDERLTLVLDLGTNGEVALGNRQSIWCASTAAGCAFEATSLRCGVGARPGAVWRVWEEVNQIHFETLEERPPIGFCGSGALSALALLRRAGWIDASGRILATSPHYVNNGQASLKLVPATQKPLQVTQHDVRQIQLAKGAIAAATQILLERAQLQHKDLQRVVLIGNFGRHLDVEAALSLGLLPPLAPRWVEVRQEATLLGAERALCSPQVCDEFEYLARRIEWVSLVEREDFVERLPWPWP